MLASAIALIIDALLLLQAGILAPCIPVPVAVEKSIRAFVQAQLAAEDCRVRKVAKGDIDKDGTDDWAIAFNVDGSCLGEPGMDNRLLIPGREVGEKAGEVMCRERLGGLLRYYHRQAA